MLYINEKLVTDRLINLSNLTAHADHLRYLSSSFHLPSAFAETSRL